MNTQPAELVDFADITEIELRVLRRMKEYTLGDHGSVFHGSGVDFVGLRDWQAGDRPSSIDWPQSSLTNFTPMVVREYEQPGTAPIVVVADQSPSTRCGMGGIPIAAGIARAIATIGLSAVYFQDMFGLITFDNGFARMASLRPRVGRGNVIHCLDGYQGRVGMEEVRTGQRLATTIGGHLRRTTLLPVISDFLFEDAAHGDSGAVASELAARRVSRDDRQRVCLRAARCVGWLGERVRRGDGAVAAGVAPRAARDGRRVKSWQDDLERQAHDAGLDVLRLDVNPDKSLPALLEFVMVRRLRK